MAKVIEYINVIENDQVVKTIVKQYETNQIYLVDNVLVNDIENKDFNNGL